MPEKNNAASDWNPTAAANKCDAIVTQAVANVEIFDNAEFGKLRAVAIGGEPWFVASDVAKILGYRDSDKVTRLLDSDEKGTQILGTPGGNQKMSIVSESGFYRAVMVRRGSCIGSEDLRERVSGFQRWVTHEVLPAIRRDGGYMAAAPEETPEQTMARALLIAQRTIERAKAEAAKLRDANAELAPKAMFADAVSASKTTILVGELAKLLRQNGVDVGQKRLFARLREDGYLMKGGSSYNLPTQRSMEMGLFEIKETTIVHSDGHTTVSKTPKVTGKGQVYFVKKFLKEATA